MSTSDAIYGGHVSMVIKTSALEYDDRLRKEIMTCRELGYSVSVDCLLDDNQKEAGYIWGGIGFRSYRLWSRRLPGGHRLVGLHVLEFLIRCLCANRFWLKRRPERLSTVLWVHDPVLLPFLPFAALARWVGVISSVIWDQHELPPEGWIGHRLLCKILTYCCHLPDCLVLANESREAHLRSVKILSDRQKTVVVHNYSDESYAALPVKPLPQALETWLDGHKYLLVQSGATSIRHAEAVFGAIMSDCWPELKVVFVGGQDDAIIEFFRASNIERFDQRICLIGKVPQCELVWYADHALASLILYRADSPNQIYCEPNRLYQAICRGIPVIVGNNPPMAEVVCSTGAGLVLSDDGAEPSGIMAAVRTVLLSAEYSLSAKRAASRFNWSSQVPVIRVALEVI